MEYLQATNVHTTAIIDKMIRKLETIDFLKFTAQQRKLKSYRIVLLQ